MRTLISLILIVFISGFLSCSDDGSTNTTHELIDTSWTRINTDDAQFSFRVKMDFFSERYDFLLLEAAEGHTDSTAKIDIWAGSFAIIEDSDCSEPEARYGWSIENDVLTMTRLFDTCEGRLKAIEGQWDRFGTVIVHTSWTRTIRDGEIRFKARLYFHSETFDFVLLEEVPGYGDSTGKLEVDGYRFKLNDDGDCPGEDGIYSWEIRDNRLQIEGIKDECEMRADSLIGEWDLFLWKGGQP